MAIAHIAIAQINDYDCVVPALPIHFQCAEQRQVERVVIVAAIIRLIIKGIVTPTRLLTIVVYGRNFIQGTNQQLIGKQEFNVILQWRRVGRNLDWNWPPMVSRPRKN
jgi:hypothetical protein